jgi:hypothetical protein
MLSDMVWCGNELMDMVKRERRGEEGEVRSGRSGNQAALKL